MATKAGVILSKVEGSETKYCVVVKRWYPFKSGNYWELNREGGNKINLTQKDLEEAFKEFTNESPGNLYINTKRVTYTGEVMGIESVVASIKGGAFDYKYGFPKGGSEESNSNDLKKTAKRELEEETGIKLNDNKFETDTFVDGDVEYYKCVLSDSLTDGEVVPDSPEPKDNHKHEIFKVLWLTIGQLKGIIEKESSKCPKQFERIITHLGGAAAAAVYPDEGHFITTPFGEAELKLFSEKLPVGLLKRTEAEMKMMEETELKQRINKTIEEYEEYKDDGLKRLLEAIQKRQLRGGEKQEKIEEIINQ